MIAFYILHGHKLEEMLSLTAAEKIFYTATMDAYLEETREAVKE